MNEKFKLQSSAFVGYSCTILKNFKKYIKCCHCDQTTQEMFTFFPGFADISNVSTGPSGEVLDNLLPAYLPKHRPCDLQVPT